MFRVVLILLLTLPTVCKLHAQDDERRWIKNHINKLSANNMDGRGYVKKGSEKAALYLQNQFEQMGLLPLGDNGSYVQFYNFRVNSFPDILNLSFRKKEFIPGVDFLVDASSSSFNGIDLKVTTINLDRIPDSASWEERKSSFTSKNIYYFKNTDSFYKRLSIPERKFAKTLPDACYIVPVHGKMTWTVGTDTMPATVFYLQDTVIPRRVRKVTAQVRSRLHPSYRNANMVGYIPGEVKDSFIVFSAHYDHLGRMGSAVFPGASDNASGTAMLLYLADYFSKHPQRYSIAFIAFSGEEAGLKGSDYFVKNPLIPLENIKFLTNVDIMGDATNGVTVVNATEFPAEFELLKTINEERKYLPAVNSRGKAANSDHYHFTEAGVPSFFIYANGGKGYYHDVFDKSPELSMTNVIEVSKLLIDFTIRLNESLN